ncbi:UDP-D-galactose:(glucosyl)LPS alpha-1,3-D-galactosyltransferase [Allocatelliglobosispora scoriae]|uniref:UDP-D-galactose:(Glucosyl)LPS alpha-1,3-D-galactosyltransferase n=1 Tax=Allocatelliglobosispora scoriae TaxID=643052 RepID=A0A841BYI9_9ACTN|nr:glycosyltransferase family 8 protein [Allocatelliglobosispora scoriae]MBB5872626.1 UDP-D-galactose:(glucosyl)LPS alpha-1,3-D-galactosyltransferase [Allocatelliglobosispora scoriae]
MDIAFAFDETYADHAQVAIETVLETHPHRDDLTMWLLTSEEAAKRRERSLERQLAGRARLRLLTAGDEFRSLPSSKHQELTYITPGMYLRLLLPELIGDGAQRLLYLDADIQVWSDLSPLWEVPMDDEVPLAAVRDAFSGTFESYGGMPGVDERHDPQAPYFNSGVLLINLPVWRRQRITEQCLAYLAEHDGNLRFPDQDALNLAAYGRWVRLPHYWNHMHSHRMEPALNEQDPAAVWDMRIMHFAGKRKPWTEDFLPGVRQERYRTLLGRVHAFAAE